MLNTMFVNAKAIILTSSIFLVSGCVVTEAVERPTFVGSFTGLPPSISEGLPSNKKIEAEKVIVVLSENGGRFISFLHSCQAAAEAGATDSFTAGSIYGGGRNATNAQQLDLSQIFVASLVQAFKTRFQSVSFAPSIDEALAESDHTSVVAALDISSAGVQCKNWQTVDETEVFASLETINFELVFASDDLLPICRYESTATLNLSDAQKEARRLGLPSSTMHQINRVRQMYAADKLVSDGSECF